MTVSYSVNQAGQLVATTTLQCPSQSKFEMVVPHEHKITETTVRSYVNAQVALQEAKLWYEYRKHVVAKLAHPVRLHITVDRTVVVGILSYAIGDHELFHVSMQDSAAYQTVYSSLGRGYARMNETHDAHGEWLPEVIKEAETILESMYRKVCHAKMYRRTYELSYALNDASE